MHFSYGLFTKICTKHETLSSTKVCAKDRAKGVGFNSNFYAGMLLKVQIRDNIGYLPIIYNSV